MNISKLEALILSVDTGSFSKAAQMLGYTQSGLTHMMNSLESEIGFKLIQRGHYGVRLTDNGEKIMPKLRRLVASEKELLAEIEAIKSSNASIIRIGAYSSIAMHWLPSIVQMFKREHPKVDIQISTGSVSDLYAGIQNERFDIVFVTHNNQYPCKFIHLKKDYLMAILPMDYPTDITAPFALKSFEGNNFLMPSLGFDIDIMTVFNDYDVHPDIVPTFVDDPAIISMIEHGLGISMLSELIIRGRSGNVLCLPTEPRVYRDIGIAMSPSKAPSDMTKKFISLSKKFAEGFNMRG